MNEKFMKSYKDLDPDFKKRIYKILHPAIIKIAEIEAESTFSSEEKEKLGYCHLLWEKQKEILLHKYGIKWESPAENNPMIMFD